MVKFKKDIKKILPYDRHQYIQYLSDGPESTKWYGKSFQLPSMGNEKINLKSYVEIYERLFKNVVLKLDSGSFWIVNHDDKDLKWFPNDADNLPFLRALFKENDTPGTFTGAVIFSTKDLLKVARDLIVYPFVVLNKDGFLYKNLDISHGKLQVIIKISGHLNIDFLSTDKVVLNEIATENSSNCFIVKDYQNNSLG